MPRLLRRLLTSWRQIRPLSTATWLQLWLSQKETSTRGTVGRLLQLGGVPILLASITSWIQLSLSNRKGYSNPYRRSLAWVSSESKSDPSLKRKRKLLKRRWWQYKLPMKRLIKLLLKSRHLNNKFLQPVVYYPLYYPNHYCFYKGLVMPNSFFGITMNWMLAFGLSCLYKLLFFVNRWYICLYVIIKSIR